jgi:hypothetical protein
VTPSKKAPDVASAPDYETRARVANGLLDSCKPQRYVYLAFAGLAACGVLAALAWMVLNQNPSKLEVGMLTTCSGVVTVSGYRILRIQSILFNVVFGTKL